MKPYLILGSMAIIAVVTIIAAANQLKNYFGFTLYEEIQERLTTVENIQFEDHKRLEAIRGVMFNREFDTTPPPNTLPFLIRKTR